MLSHSLSCSHCLSSASALSGDFAHSFITKQENDTTEVEREEVAVKIQKTENVYINRLKKILLAILLLQGKEVVQRYGSDYASPIPMDAQTRWKNQLYEEQARLAMGAAEATINLVNNIYSFPAMSTNFMVMKVYNTVQDYFKYNAGKQVDTIVNKIEDIINEVNKEQTELENGLYRPLTDKEKKKGISDRFKDFATVYAALLARTGIVWGSQSGIKARYVDVGIKKVRWYAQIDERVCPFCFSLHDTVIEINVDFVAAGGQVIGIEQLANGELKSRILQIPYDSNISHPPVHPNCRCVLLPEFQILTIGGF